MVPCLQYQSESSGPYRVRKRGKERTNDELLRPMMKTSRLLVGLSSPCSSGSQECEAGDEGGVKNGDRRDLYEADVSDVSGDAADDYSTHRSTACAGSVRVSCRWRRCTTRA